MSLDIIYPSSSSYSVGRPLAAGKSVFQLQRPKSLAEVNKYQHTPFTERKCYSCRKKLYDHFYLPFLDAQKRSRLWCRKDATSYYYKELYPY